MAKILGSVKYWISFIFQSKLRIAVVAVVAVVLALLGFGGWQIFASNSNKPQYQTMIVEKGTLVSSVSASGNIISGNSVDITTQATGVVSNVDVQNGDTVTAGGKIADILPDPQSQQKLAQSWSSYLQAKTQLDSANANLNTLQNQEFVANQKFINDAVARNLATNDPTYIEENASWLAAEQAYQNQQQVIAQAQAGVNSAALSYQQISSVITAPASGTITNLTLTPGFPVTASQKLGSITMDQTRGLQASVNLSEIDATKVSPGQKVTITLDAFPNKTFTGRVLTINTGGVVNSGVTTYPVVLSLDTAAGHIYPNMAVNAKIITLVKNNVLLIPTQAVQTQNGQSKIRVLKNGQVRTVMVEVGDASDTQTEIKSGLNEGETVVTGFTGTGSGSRSTSSPFGGSGGFGALRSGGFGGGGNRAGGR